MKLKELRVQNGLTQKQVADIASISQSNYSKYEVGKLKPDSEVLIKLANHYDVSIDFLCERPFYNKIGYIPEEKREIVQQIVSLNKIETNQVLAFIQGLKCRE